MLLSRIFFGRFPYAVLCQGVAIALATVTWCQAGGPPLKMTGFPPRGSHGAAHHGCAHHGACLGGHGCMGGHDLSTVDWGMDDSWCPDSFESECPSTLSSSCHGSSCCHGKCRCRRSDGIVRHCGLPAPNYPVPFATPRPTTPTLLWYPPMMPHNSLPHYRGTYSYRHAPGLSRTTVAWHPTYVWNAFDKLHHMIELPR